MKVYIWFIGFVFVVLSAAWQNEEMETTDDSISEADANISDMEEIEDMRYIRQRRSPDPDPNPRGIRARKKKKKAKAWQNATWETATTTRVPAKLKPANSGTSTLFINIWKRVVSFAGTISLIAVV